VIRALSETDDPSGFSCGSRALDRYLKVHALSNAEAGISVTYVHTGEGGGVNGYVTLAGSSIRSCETHATHSLPAYPLPALLVARLAVDVSSQHHGIGRKLLTFALEEALVLHARTGCVAVVVDAKRAAVAFYQRFGFEPAAVASPANETVRAVLEIGSILDGLI